MSEIKSLAEDVCMLCGAYGPDRWPLLINCFYDLREVVPELEEVSHEDNLLLEHGYGINLCKTCRSEMLGALKSWADDRRAQRSMPKDSDDHPWSSDYWGPLPVLNNGKMVVMNRNEYDAWKRASG